MIDFLEYFYLAFSPLDDNYEYWAGDGESYGAYIYGFWILLGVCFLFSVIYYLIIGRITDSFDRLSSWFVTLLLTALTVYGVSIFYIARGVYEVDVLKADSDAWFFALHNSLNTILIFLVFSLLLNNLSKYNKFVPFNILKK